MFNHAIIVFTKAATTIGAPDVPSFTQYINNEKKSSNSPLNKFLEMCNYRTIAHENHPSTTFEEDLQRENMLELIRSTVEHAQKPLYDNELFKEAQKRRSDNKSMKRKTDMFSEAKANVALSIKSILETKGIATIYNWLQEDKGRENVCSQSLDFIVERLKASPEHKDLPAECWKKENFTPIIEEIKKLFPQVASETIKYKAQEALAQKIQAMRKEKLLKHQDVDVMTQKVMDGLPPSVKKNVTKEDVKNVIERSSKESPSEMSLKTEIINYACVDPCKRCDQAVLFEHFNALPEVHEVCDAEGVNLKILIEECSNHPKMKKAAAVKRDGEKKMKANTRKEEMVYQVIMQHVLKWDRKKMKQMYKERYESEIDDYMEEVKDKLETEWLRYLPNNALKDSIVETLDTLIENMTEKSWLDRLKASKLGLFISGKQGKN